MSGGRQSARIHHIFEHADNTHGHDGDRHALVDFPIIVQ